MLVWQTLLLFLCYFFYTVVSKPRDGRSKIRCVVEVWFVSWINMSCNWMTEVSYLHLKSVRLLFIYIYFFFFSLKISTISLKIIRTQSIQTTLWCDSSCDHRGQHWAALRSRDVKYPNLRLFWLLWCRGFFTCLVVVIYRFSICSVFHLINAITPP